MTALIRAWLLAALAVFAATASGHELSMAEMELREVSRGEFLWQWTVGEKGAIGSDLSPNWPDHCRVDTVALRCGEAGLQGALSIDGVGKRYSAALVKVYWLDGQSRVYTLTAGRPTVHLHGSADDERGMLEIASAYTLLGVEHILTGIDHLMFVLGLLFLVSFRRQLVWTITAFTAAHSVTLACSALGLLALRSPPVEATIALSIMLVAAEALRRRETLARRWPALVAFLFGLVHGLGFAGALKEIGLPDHHLWIALLSFNVGVEAGQLMWVGAAWLVYRGVRGMAHAAPARVAALYVIGTAAAFWSLTRMAAILA